MLVKVETMTKYCESYRNTSMCRHHVPTKPKSCNTAFTKAKLYPEPIWQPTHGFIKTAAMNFEGTPGLKETRRYDISQASMEASFTRNSRKSLLVWPYFQKNEMTSLMADKTAAIHFTEQLEKGEAAICAVKWVSPQTLTAPTFSLGLPIGFGAGAWVY